MTNCENCTIKVSDDEIWCRECTAQAAFANFFAQVAVLACACKSGCHMPELARLISGGRVVKADLGCEVLECRANKDIPSLGIKAGQMFWLHTSETYAGYCYIVRNVAGDVRNCSCGHFAVYRECKHANGVNARCAAKNLHITLAELMRQRERKAEQAAHVSDEIRAGKEGKRAQVKIVSSEERKYAPLNGNRGYELLKPAS